MIPEPLTDDDAAASHAREASLRRELIDVLRGIPNNILEAVARELDAQADAAFHTIRLADADGTPVVLSENLRKRAAELRGQKGSLDDAAASRAREVAAATPKLRDALEMVLLFHHALEWNHHARARWLQVTGFTDATTRSLCDHIQKVLGQ